MILFSIPFSRTIKSYFEVKSQLKKDRLSDWVFDSETWIDVHRWSDDWIRHYLPVDVRGKAVLDVGAHQGETAKFFLDHGACKVFGVEMDDFNYMFLKYNSFFHKGVVPFHAKFVRDFLDLPFDFLKVDIEGWEEEFLDIDLDRPAVFEVHGLQLIDAFRRKGFRMVKPFYFPQWLCYAYWLC